MTGVFCYVDCYPNIISPFYAVSVEIKGEKNKLYNFIFDKINEENLSDENLVRLCKSLNRFLIKNFLNKSLKIQYYKLGKYELEKYGLNSSFLKALDYFNILYPNNIVYSSNIKNLRVYEKYKVLDTFSSNLELFLGYIYSRALRNFYLKRFHSTYKHLDILKTKGEITYSNLSQLAELKILPEFYIESSVIYYFIKNNIKLPSWASSYVLKNYDKFIK